MNKSEIILSAVKYFGSDAKRINHFMKVYGYAKTIGELEHLNEREQDILEVAAILHDIGIKISEEKYGSSAGIYQEKEGPAVAEQLLKNSGYDKEFVERVKYLIGHHHTYDNITGMDYQILVEADFIVNIYEDDMDWSVIKKIIDRIFRTETGTLIVKEMFLQSDK